MCVHARSPSSDSLSWCPTNPGAATRRHLILSSCGGSPHVSKLGRKRTFGHNVRGLSWYARLIDSSRLPPKCLAVSVNWLRALVFITNLHNATRRRPSAKDVGPEGRVNTNV